MNYDDPLEAARLHLGLLVYRVICQRKICDPSIQFRCHKSGKTLCATMWPMFYALNKLKLLRISIGEEVLGLDISRHGGYAYAHDHAHQENNDPRSHADYMHIQDDQSKFDFMILLVLGIAL
ncbi:hypothetical protein AHAS_Ahas11G0039200 [Arachis hypogaea]